MSGSGATGIVLAGGRSTRFGADKLAAEVGGRPLLHLAVVAVGSVVDEVVVVIAPNAPLPSLPASLGVPVVVARDAVAGQGPLAGLAAGLAVASQPFAIVAGGDQPTLRPALLRELLARLISPGGRRVDVVGLEEDGRLRPLPVALRVETCGPAVTRALAWGARSLLEVFGSLDTATLDPARRRELDPEGESLRDIDTPDDLPPA